MNAFLNFIRWREWGPDKIAFFFTFFFYIALADRLFTLSYIKEFLSLTIFISSLAVYGYLINELGDKESDRRAGKRNSLGNLGPFPAALLFGAIFLIMALSGTRFARQSWFVVLWGGQIITATSYSLPPLRLKTRGGAGLIANLVAQFTLPTALIFSAFGHLTGPDALVLPLCATLIWTAAELGHQRHHLAGDRLAGDGTLAVAKGHDAISRMYARALGVSRAAIGLLIGWLLFGIPPVIISPPDIAVPPALPLALLYLLLLARCAGRRRAGIAGTERSDPYHYRGERGADNLLHAVFPNVIVPLYLAALMTCYFIYNLLLLGFFLLWLSPAISRRKLQEIYRAAMKRG